MRIYCDFDGTVTTADTTDLVLAALAAPQWRLVEDDWLAGRISAAECMRRQVSLIRGDRPTLERVLRTVTLRQGLPEFVGWCARQAIPFTIVSDGIDAFIHSILARHGLAHLPVVANRLAASGPRWRLSQPWSTPGCAAGSGVCKCSVLGPSTPDQEPTVYIGDGRSDFCAASRVGMVFARGSLVEHLAQQNRPFWRFETFHEIAAVLQRLRDRPFSIAGVA
jgi:2,3-diketo-5-methylthio-1-phosphopentane phosphatase